MWPLLFVAACVTPPKVFSLPVVHGNIMVNTWMQEHRDSLALRRSKQVYDGFRRKYECPSPSLKCVALLNEDRIGAIALLEKIEQSLVLWDLSINDDSSGSTLLRTICTTTPSLKVASTVDDRWKIASLYYTNRTGP